MITTVVNGISYISTCDSANSNALNQQAAKDLHRLANEIEDGTVSVQRVKVTSNFIGDGYDSKSMLEVEFLTNYLKLEVK